MYIKVFEMGETHHQMHILQIHEYNERKGKKPMKSIPPTYFVLCFVINLCHIGFQIVMLKCLQLSKLATSLTELNFPLSMGCSFEI